MYTAGVRGQSKFHHLLSPGRIGRLETRNRIVMSPMGTNLGEENGHVSARQLRYYEERARGGAGLVIVGVAAVAYPHGQAIPRQVAVSDDSFLPGLTELADRIRRHGAKAAVQLQHAGKVATQDIAAGRPLMVPSVIPYGGGGMEDLTADEVQSLVSNLTAPGARLHYHELSRDDIAGLVGTFADAAARARRAGFDAVEIHAGHGYILSAFLSRAANLRTDEYGGSAENRARFLVEVGLVPPRCARVPDRKRHHFGGMLPDGEVRRGRRDRCHPRQRLRQSVLRHCVHRSAPGA
jgi:2,4-dienoyl-CoA reductase-like NADH-dependent reductase (Old Yellow Enzyme family)